MLFGWKKKKDWRLNDIRRRLDTLNRANLVWNYVHSIKHQRGNAAGRDSGSKIKNQMPENAPGYRGNP